MVRQAMGEAADHWRAALAQWQLPDWLLQAAPESPYGFPLGVWSRQPADVATSPTGRAVLGFLDGGGLVDVGCGAGRITAAFTDAAAWVVGVEPAEHLAEAARETGIEVVARRWPDAADEVPVADVALATHVLYDVWEAVPFVAAMQARARRAVVLELSEAHPWAGLGPLYRRFHGLDRPTGPTADDAAAVVTEATGVSPSIERWQRAGTTYPNLGSLVAHRRRQLCLSSDRDAEVAEALSGSYTVGPDGEVITGPADLAALWWAVPPQAG
jgi:SAM-dependent methyltransferase